MNRVSKRGITSESDAQRDGLPATRISSHTGFGKEGWNLLTWVEKRKELGRVWEEITLLQQYSI